MTGRSRALGYGACVAMVFAGVVCALAISGSTGGTICTGLVGVGLVGIMSLVFYEVGLSEDRDRRRPQPRPSGLPRPRRELKRHAPERVRDHRRRLR